MSKQPEQHAQPQRRMSHGIIFATTIVGGTLLGMVIGFAPLGIVLTVIVGILLGIFNKDMLKQHSPTHRHDH